MIRSSFLGPEGGECGRDACASRFKPNETLENRKWVYFRSPFFCRSSGLPAPCQWRCLWRTGIRLEKPPVYRMMWKVFCGNSIINSYGTNKSLRNRNRQASILAAAQWEKKIFIWLSDMKNFL